MFKTGRRSEAEKQTFIRSGRMNTAPEGGDRSPVTPGRAHINKKEDYFMDFFNSAVDVLQTLVIALGAASASGVPSTCSKATATTIPVRSHRE